MSCVERLDWLNEDIRDYLACSRYILFRCCKKAKRKYKLGRDIPNWEKSIETEYLPIEFADFKWVVDRCNFKLSKSHGVNLLPNGFVAWYEDGKYVPEYFNAADWTCEYRKGKNGKLQRYPRKRGEEFKEEDFLSGADIWAMRSVIRRWKIYGKWMVRLEMAWFSLKWKLRRSK